jgi:hypothetical protein
MNKANIV